jgi:thioredoxin-dependent peroxiredoxin
VKPTGSSLVGSGQDYLTGREEQRQVPHDDLRRYGLLIHSTRESRRQLAWCERSGISVDSVPDHEKWSKDIEETQGHAVNYPLIGDPELKVAKAYDMLPEDTGTTAQGRTAADNATVRSVFVIGPDKRIKAMLTYPMSTGRNFDEVLRLLDSCQLTATHKVATPVNWKPGQDVIIVPAVSDAEAKQAYPGGWKAPKPYIRIVPQPR